MPCSSCAASQTVHRSVGRQPIRQSCEYNEPIIVGIKPPLPGPGRAHTSTTSATCRTAHPFASVPNPFVASTILHSCHCLCCFANVKPPFQFYISCCRSPPLLTRAAAATILLPRSIDVCLWPSSAVSSLPLSNHFVSKEHRRGGASGRQDNFECGRASITN